MRLQLLNAITVAIVVALWGAIAITTVTALPVRMHSRLHAAQAQLQRHRFKTATHMSRVAAATVDAADADADADADGALETDADTEADADSETNAAAAAAAAAAAGARAAAEAEVMAEIEFGVTSESASKHHLSAAFRAEVSRLKAVMEARDRARLNAEFSRESARAQHNANANTNAKTDAQASASASASARASARVYDAVRTPAVCTAMWTWLQALNADFVARAGPAVTDATVITNWNGGGNLANYVQLTDNVLAADIVAYLRYAYRGAPLALADAVCTAGRLQVAALAHAASTAGAANIAGFTMGVEWELKWLQVDPPDQRPGNDPVVLAQTAGNSPVGGQRWLKVVSDVSSNELLIPAAPHSYTIPEFISGPDFIDPHNNGNGMTRDVIRNIKFFVDHLQAHMLAAAVAPDAGGDAPARGYQYLLLSAIGPAVHERLEGGLQPVHPHPAAFQLTDFPDPTGIANLAGAGHNYAGPRHGFAVRPTNYDRDVGGWFTPADPPANMCRGYVQTNFLMPISALASHQFSNADGNDRGIRERYAEDPQPAVFMTASLRACYETARETILADVPLAALAALSPAQRADLLGIFTLFNYHFLYRWYCAGDMSSQDIAWGDAQPSGFPRVHGAHFKNWFDIMPKTSAHEAMLLADPPIAEVLREWYMSHDFRNEADWAHTIAYLHRLRARLAASAAAVVRGWAAAATGITAVQVARKGWALARLRSDLQMFDPLTLHNPPAAPANVYHAFSTSPTHSRPPAYRVGADHILSIVMEARDGAIDPLNTLVADAQTAAVNVWLAQHLVQKTWDHTADQYAQ